MNFHSFAKVAWLVILIISQFLSGCSQAPGRQGLTDQRATEIAENVLQAINDGNYSNFSRDFSSNMKKEIPQSDFANLRELILKASGLYNSILETVSVDDERPGYIVYIFTCQFENGQFQLNLTFKEGIDQIEGLFISSVT